MAVDDLVDSIETYNPRPLVIHAYAAPFMVLYAACLYFWIGVLGFNEHMEGGCIALAIVGILQVLTALFCHWFVNVRCLFTCSHSCDVYSARLVKVCPTTNNGWAELVPLVNTKDHLGNDLLHFTFQKLKYVYDPDKHLFRAVEFPVNHTLAHYRSSSGLEEANISESVAHYGTNKMEMAIPEFLDLFKERATAPFFVFQVFCVLLWCLDEYWYYSLFTLCMLIAFEATLVKQQLKNMSEIRNMGNKPYPIQVYRNKKWRPIPSDELIPGDIVSVGRAVDDRPVPCDLLVLRGPCIVDESMLTGESVPQMKEPLEDISDANRELDLDIDGKLHVLFGGTKVVQHSPPAKTSPGIKSPDNGCICYVLKTGFNTSQGKLLRTILFSVKRATANNLETFGFILFLLMFAIAASGYVWIKGTADPDRNRYKLFLECTLILTSVVPPELPIELSLAVNNSLIALSKLGVYCTEPFRIPFGGKINICAFDKTGTLTTDNLVVEGISGLKDREKMCPLSDAPMETIQVLASCHSLVQLEDDMVGDPLEKACLNSVEWVLTKNDTVIPKKGKNPPLKIVYRFHFSSALKRMSAIVGYMQPGNAEPYHMAVAKGAPEILKPMFKEAPEQYDSVYQELTRQGARVLALGFKQLGQLSHQQIRETTRDHLETQLEFAGFVVISCPLKPDSRTVIKEIQNSSHQVIMITGDNALTACHVAKVLRFTRKETTLILDTPKNGLDWQWRSVDENTTLPAFPKGGPKSLYTKFDLCLTGPALTYLSSSDRQFLLKILPFTKVFARVAPKQKEFVITSLKWLGFTTLMCGDGTNDVGALKHADVGVALLSHPVVTASADKQGKTATQNATDATPPSGASGKTLSSGSSSAQPKKSSTQIVGGQRIVSKNHGIREAQASAAQKRAEKINQMLKSLEEEEKAALVKLGDASIAAPFTSRWSSIQCICHVIKQGRCTLVTTLQMFKILALNALVLAYSQSVLYLDGIKFSDTQATIQGLLLAACFLFISRSKPLTVLSRQRPLANIFNFYTLLTVTSQFAVHFYCLFYLVNEAHGLSPPREGKINLEEKFKPNIVNSTVYVMSVALQLSTFAVNYKGHPFMESLYENKPLLYSLLSSGTAVLVLASGLMPDMTEQLELVLFPAEFRNTVLLVLVSDFLCCWLIDRILAFVIGDTRARNYQLD